MATEAPPAPTETTTPASPKESFLEALQGGYELKAAGKLTVDDPMPEGVSPEPSTPTESGPAPQASKPTDPATKPGPVAPRPIPKEVTDKRTATAQQWKEVNEDRERLRTRIKELEGLKTKLDETTKTVGDVEGLKAKLSEYDTILRQVAAERHPDLIGPINAKLDAAVKVARGAVPKEQADDVERILRSGSSDDRDAQLDSILDSLTTTKRARLMRAMADIEEANNARSTLAERSQQVLQQRDQQMRQRHEANLKEFDSEVSEWTNPEHGIELLVEKPGDIEHNDRRSAILANAKALFAGEVTSVRDLARAAIWSSFGETLNRQNQALLQKVQEQQEIITKLKGGTPGLENTGAGDAAPSELTEKPKNMPLSQWVAIQAQKEGMQFGRSY